MGNSLDRIAQRLRERVEYSSESDLFDSEYASASGPSYLANELYQRTMRLKGSLIEEFQNQSLSDFYSTEVLENEYGSCLKISHSTSQAISLKRSQRVLAALSGELQLIYGIGPSLASDLKCDGYESISDLESHEKWGRSAKALLEHFHDCDVRQLQSNLERWFPKSHTAGYQLIELCHHDQIIFFDIESLGLFGRPAILFGVGRINAGELLVEQYLVRDIMEELPALLEIGNALGEEPALVTYNGRAFDSNFLQERWGYYGLMFDFEPIHFDLLYAARKRFRDELPNAKLETVEQHFGVKREIDLPGSLVPDFYNTYLEQENIGPLIPIIEHNKQDIISPGILLSEFCK